MSRVVIRPANKADCEAMFDEPLPYRVRAFVGELDGERIGLGGLAFMPDGTVAAFLHVKEGARRHKVTMHKAGLMIMAEAKRLGLRRVVAMAEPGLEPATRWLERLGFEAVMVDGEKVYVWQTQSH